MPPSPEDRAAALRAYLTKNPAISSVQALVTLSVYKTSRAEPWFAQVLQEFGIKYKFTPQTNRWTPERIQELIAANGWKTRADMRAHPQGKNILWASCGRANLLAVLPPARFKSPSAPRQKAAGKKQRTLVPPMPRILRAPTGDVWLAKSNATVPANCWPFAPVTQQETEPCV